MSFFVSSRPPMFVRSGRGSFFVASVPGYFLATVAFEEWTDEEIEAFQERALKAVRETDLDDLKLIVDIVREQGITATEYYATLSY